MTEYIKREDAIKAIEWTWAGKAAFDAIEELPAADVVERKTGKWNCGDDMFEYAICSSCKWDSGEAWEYARKQFNYCPNCGSKMVEAGNADV